MRGVGFEPTKALSTQDFSCSRSLQRETATLSPARLTTPESPQIKLAKDNLYPQKSRKRDIKKLTHPLQYY